MYGCRYARGLILIPFELMEHLRLLTTTGRRASRVVADIREREYRRLVRRDRKWKLGLVSQLAIISPSKLTLCRRKRSQSTQATKTT